MSSTNLPDSICSESHAKTMKPRQLIMMGLGSAIGAGLFMGSGEGIHMAGPAVLISYIIAGMLVIIVMNAMGEMAVANPSGGAFSVYATDAFGPTVGVTIGWLWWLQMVIVVAAEAIGAAQLLTLVFPSVSSPCAALVCMGLFSVINLQGVRHFGEFEFYFAIIKVVAIFAFILVGLALLFGFTSKPSPGFFHFVAHGGFAPKGIGGICSALLVVIFAFGGMEIVAVAAAETRDSGTHLGQTIRLVAWRILIFYIASISVIVAIIPWNNSSALKSPFAAVLAAANMPNAGIAMTIIAILALLSALNVNLYGASRMLFSLAERQEAPALFKRLNAQHIPTYAVLTSSAAGLVAALFEFLFPEKVLSVLLNCVGSTNLLIWIVSLMSQWVLRSRAKRLGKVLSFRMWGFPWLTLFALVTFVSISVLLVLSAETRLKFLSMFALTLIIAIITGGVRSLRLKQMQSKM